MSFELACQQVVRAMMPKGAAWEPKPGGNYDKILDATGEIINLICQRMLNARYVRNPKKTFVLDDLEREYGVLKNTLVSEAQRRITLDAKKYRASGGGTADDLQSALDNAGFDLLVHKNDPAVDPNIFLNQNFHMVANGDNAYAGYTLDGITIDSFAGKLGGDLLVNKSIFNQLPAYNMQANGSVAFAGNGSAVAGYFDSIQREEITYQVPVDPDDWPFVFFVGGEATRDPVTNELLTIAQGLVSNERREELERIVLSYKPLFTWAAMIITYN